MQPATLDELIHIVSVVLIACMAVFAYRSGTSRKEAESQSNTIKALETELGLLKDRILHVEQENNRLTQTIGIIRSALSKRGMIITIEGDLVTISDSRGSIQSTNIQSKQL